MCVCVFVCVCVCDISSLRVNKPKERNMWFLLCVCFNDTISS